MRAGWTGALIGLAVGLVSWPWLDFLEGDYGQSPAAHGDLLFWLGEAVLASAALAWRWWSERCGWRTGSIAAICLVAAFILFWVAFLFLVVFPSASGD